MPTLPEAPVLKDFQTYVARLEEERGFDHQDALQKCLLLGEEVGELFKAVRKSSGMSIDASSAVTSVGEEMADIIIMLCAIANRLDVDLERAFREKERVNAARVWKEA